MVTLLFVTENSYSIVWLIITTLSKNWTEYRPVGTGTVFSRLLVWTGWTKSFSFKNFWSNNPFIIWGEKWMKCSPWRLWRFCGHCATYPWHLTCWICFILFARLIFKRIWKPTFPCSTVSFILFAHLLLYSISLHVHVTNCLSVV